MRTERLYTFTEVESAITEGGDDVYRRITMQEFQLHGRESERGQAGALIDQGRNPGAIARIRRCVKVGLGTGVAVVR